MNIGNITSNNFNLDVTGKDIQIEVYEQLIEQLQQENKQLKEEVEEYKNPIKYFKYANKNVTNENEKLKANWIKLKDYFNERIEVCDNRLSSPFCNFEKTTKERLIFSQCLEKLEELEGSDSNENNNI